jgi:hypothetical protein
MKKIARIVRGRQIEVEQTTGVYYWYWEPSLILRALQIARMAVTTCYGL